MGLFRGIAWLESKRMKYLLILLPLIAIGTGVFLGIGKIDLTNIDYSFEYNSSSSGGMPSPPLSFNVLEQVLKFGPPIVLSFFALMAGGFLAVLAPFRGDREWSEGQFQLLRLSKHSMLSILLVRLTLYVLTFWLFATIILTMGSIAILRVDDDYTMLIKDAYTMFQIGFWTYGPLIMSLGIFIDSIRTAYYMKGSKIVTNIIPILGWLVIGLAISDAFQFVQGKLFDPWLFTAIRDVTLLGDTGIPMFKEPLLLTVLTSFVLCYLGSRILEEVEA